MDLSREIIEAAAKQAEVGTDEYWRLVTEMKLEADVKYHEEYRMKYAAREERELADAMKVSELREWLGKLPQDMPIRCISNITEQGQREELKMMHLRIVDADYLNLKVLYIGYDDEDTIETHLEQSNASEE